MENGIIINVVNVKPSIFNFAEEHIGLKTEDLHKERLICNKKYIYSILCHFIKFHLNQYHWIYYLNIEMCFLFKTFLIIYDHFFADRETLKTSV